MTVAQAVAKRINELLREKNMTQYRLERKSGILHGTLNGVMMGTHKNVQLNTIMIIARGFDMTFLEFLDSPIFTSETLEIE